MLLLLPPLAPAASLSMYEERGLQTDERLDFSTALRQLQVVTQGKFQLEWELLREQHEQNMREDELIARDISKIQAAATKQKEQLTDKQEDQQVRVQEQFTITFREVLFQVSPVDSLRLLTWFFSTADNPVVVPTHSIGEVLTAALQPKMEAFAGF